MAFLTSSGHSAVFSDLPPSAADLAATDVLFLTSNNGNSNMLTWLTAGGRTVCGGGWKVVEEVEEEVVVVVAGNNRSARSNVVLCRRYCHRRGCRKVALEHQRSGSDLAGRGVRAAHRPHGAVRRLSHPTASLITHNVAQHSVCRWLGHLRAPPHWASPFQTTLTWCTQHRRRGVPTQASVPRLCHWRL